ncbi:unnamed protein product [Prunus armeniaca]|uniref:Uncharacterized protein n=1 Tax=Prunus armeniaca TaxID=36596 RepID=A0A6J5U3L4_PRUAR|nr:unnamed protein product [Prunus armeniaca]CAB4300100.1 unnamed protein product [Prunus armeniaca]
MEQNDTDSTALQIKHIDVDIVFHYASLEATANWVVEHENNPNIMPSVLVNTKVEAPKPSLTLEQLKAKQQELREKARKKK